MEQLKSFFKGKAINNILDVGTGSGQFMKILIDIFPEAILTGVDPNNESLQKARESILEENISFVEMKGETLNFKNSRFDIVSLSNALHHLPHITTSLSEMKRVLKPNGWIVINELFSDNLNPAQENQKFYHHIKSYTDRLLGTYHHQTWTKQEILNIIQQNGIKIITHFEEIDTRNFITNTETINYWVNRLKDQIDIIKGQPEYQNTLLRVEEFRRRIKKNGMQHATNVVVIGKNLI